MGSHVGLAVWVKLKPPSNNVIYGTVQDLVPNSHLTLRDVSFPGSTSKLDHFTVQASAIENLEVIDSKNPPQYPPPQPNPPASTAPNTTFNQAPPRHVSAPPQPYSASPALQRHASPFVDPAIVSLGSVSPAQNQSAPKPTELEAPVTPIKAMLARAAQNLPSPSSPFIGEAGRANVTHKLVAARTPPVHLQQKPPPVVVAVDAQQQDSANADNGTRKKIRRGGGKSKKQSMNPLEDAESPPVMNIEVSRNSNAMNGTVKRGKGWRNTPLLQPSPQPDAPADKANTKKSRRKQQEAQEFAQGDTTDIPDVDFDFESELRKFDKKQVFDEIRQGDTTADEDLLVSHNRARPGTYGGKNLHPTEPVLSPKIGPRTNSNGNDLASSSDADTELNFGNGRSSSRHSVTRAVLGKKQPSRSNSGQVETKPHPLTASVSSERVASRAAASGAGKSKGASSLAASSPRPDRAYSPQSALSNSRLVDASHPDHFAQPHFMIEPNMAPCPTLLPQALDTLEDAAVATYGLTHEAFTEIAAMRIAEAALRLSDLLNGIRRPSRTNTLRGSVTSHSAVHTSTEVPVVVILAGNHLVGARALAAARHLVYRNIKIIVAESSLDHDEVQDPHMKAQSTVTRRMMRAGAKIKRGLWKKASGYIKNLHGPPAVIIDALLAGSPYESLRSADLQEEAREMIDWANRSRAPVLSVACPSGVSGIDGQATLVEGEPLAVRPDRVLALGAPMTGLLKAVEGGEKWHVGLADIGINVALKSDEAVAFGDRWVTELKFADGQTVDGEGS